MALTCGFVSTLVCWGWCGGFAGPLVGVCGCTPESPSTAVDGLVAEASVAVGATG